MAVADGAITGTLHKLSTGSLPTTWGEGYFMALKFTDNDSGAATLKVGMEPSEGSGLVELDEDMNGVFKVTDKDAQDFRTVATDGRNSTTITDYDLSGLTLDDGE